jgi:hypothetical protein
VRLLGPYDLYLQGRDRDLLVADRVRAKELWPVLGRPGAVVEDGEIAGSWRPRAAGKRFSVSVGIWREPTKRLLQAVEEQAGRLAGFRGLVFRSVEVENGS